MPVQRVLGSEGNAAGSRCSSIQGDNFTAPVKTTAIDAKNKLVGFQGDFTFDERVVTFQHQPVRKAGLPPGTGTCRGTFCRDLARSGRCAYPLIRTTSRRSRDPERCSTSGWPG